ncbi:hypothetical protein S245_004835, partial [Arachis hypogaea]
HVFYYKIEVVNGGVTPIMVTNLVCVPKKKEFVQFSGSRKGAWKHIRTLEWKSKNRCNSNYSGNDMKTSSICAIQSIVQVTHSHNPFSLRRIPLNYQLFVIHILYKGPEMPCLRIIGKCININTAVRR